MGRGLLGSSLEIMWPARLVRSFCILQVRGSVGLVRMASGGTDRALNRLAQEKSPYLLQHASNPVDWYEQHTVVI